MPALISTHFIYSFLPFRIKDYLPNLCGENYQNENSIISDLWLSLLSSLSSDTQSYTKFLQLKSTN